MKELLVDGVVTLSAAALGLLVNSATFIAMLLNRRQLSAKAYLVISLTLGGIVTVVGSVLHTLFNEQAITGIECLSKAQVLMRDIKYTGIILSMLGLNALCVDLYVAVMHSIRYRLVCSKRRIRVLICLKWLVGILLGCASSISHAIIGIRQKTKRQCKFSPTRFEPPSLSESIWAALNQSQPNQSQLIKPILKSQQATMPPAPPPPLMSLEFLLYRFYISDCILVVVLAITVLFITASLSQIYRKLRRRLRRNGNLAAGEHSSSACSGLSDNNRGGIRRHCSINGPWAKRRGASTILLLFVGFNATVLPYMIGEFYSIIITSRVQTKSSNSSESDLQFILYFMPYLTALAVGYTVLNPVVLSLRMREVQAGYIIIWRRICKNNQQQQQQQQQKLQEQQQQFRLRLRRHQSRDQDDSMLTTNDDIGGEIQLAPLGNFAGRVKQRTCSRSSAGSNVSSNGRVSFYNNDRTSRESGCDIQDMPG